MYYALIRLDVSQICYEWIEIYYFALVGYFNVLKYMFLKPWIRMLSLALLIYFKIFPSQSIACFFVVWECIYYFAVST